MKMLRTLYVFRCVLSILFLICCQGYEDDPVEDGDGEEDDEDDGSYADEEYGKKKITRTKKQPSKPKGIQVLPYIPSACS